jgi:hypothetical protein
MSLFNDSGAIFSKCNQYRYALWRIWDESLPKAMCIGLNPSKANATKNDNTISLLIAMLKQLGYGGFYMTNLFAWISSNPDDLLTCADPIGENDYYLEQIREKCDVVIACWGAFKQIGTRAEIVMEKLTEVKCFGTNENGSPWHPRALLYNGTSKSPLLKPFKTTAL